MVSDNEVMSVQSFHQIYAQFPVHFFKKSEMDLTKKGGKSEFF